MNRRTFHGFEGAIQGHIFTNRDEKIVEGRGRSAAITRNYTANVRQDMSDEPEVSRLILS